MKYSIVLVLLASLLAVAFFTPMSADARGSIARWAATRTDVHVYRERVGIGTNSPNAILHVANWQTGDDLLRVTPMGSEFGGTAAFEDITAENGTFETVTILGGSDIAEPFDIRSDVAVLPGMVVAIDANHVGKLRLADKAYDATVAGIVSGANGIATGMTLKQDGTIADGKYPVALTGRVWCWCDADTGGAIVAGDMLTTSDTAGHAMKAADVNKRDGAVLGKAMSSLKTGKGLVLVLVSLQ